MTQLKKYFKKAEKMAHRLSFLPGIKAIYLSGSLATKTDNENSDIDFFIIAHQGQIFTARFFTNLFLKVFGQLAKPKNHAGKICPNHFVTDKNLELEEKNQYTAIMFSCNIPLFDSQNTWDEFQNKNQWIIQKFSQKFVHQNKTQKLQTFKKCNWIEKYLEKILKKIQIWKIKQNKNFLTSEKIVLTDKELRFHPILKSKE